MKKKNIYLIVIVIILLIILISISVYKSISPKKANNIKEADTYNFYNYDTKNKLKICKTDKCKVLKEVDYELLSIEYNIPELKKAIEKINNDTLKYYEDSKKSKVEGTECEKVKNLYNYRIITTSIFSNCETNDYISIAITRKHSDLCTEKAVDDDIEVYIYDKSQEKILTTDEFKAKEQITEDVINNSISNYDEENEYNFEVTNETKYYLSIDGKVFMHLLDKNSNKYHDIEIIK